MQKRFAFTLIELLVVVAIIAILAAIAVPNFLEAQVRAKVARVKADMRSVATALEAYAVDYNHFPPDRGIHTLKFCSLLTTPVAYITNAAIKDPFSPDWYVIRPEWNLSDKDQSFLYVNCAGHFDPAMLYGPAEAGTYNPQANWGGTFNPVEKHRRAAIIASFGPDRRYNYGEWYPFDKIFGPPYAAMPTEMNEPEDKLYDPTNGTVSQGDLGRSTGDLQGMRVFGG